MMTTPRGRTPSFTDQVTLRVDGMVCEHCSADVEAALSGVVGVVSAVVDLSRKQATVHGTASAAVPPVASPQFRRRWRQKLQ